MTPAVNWTRKTNSDCLDCDSWINGIFSDGSGGIIAIRKTYDLTDGTHTGFLDHYDADGNKVWTYLIGTNTYDCISSAAADGTGGIFIAGLAYEIPDDIFNHTNKNGFIDHYNSSGNKTWSRAIDSGRDSDITGIIADRKGGVFAGGTTYGKNDIQIHNTKYSGFVARYDSSGSELWTHTNNSDSDNYIERIIEDASGGVFVAGSTYGSIEGQTYHGERDGFISHYDSDGNKSWTRIIGSETYDFIDGIISDGSGGVYVATRSGGAINGQTFNEIAGGFISHYDRSGNKSWTRKINSDYESYIAIKEDGGDGVFVTTRTDVGTDSQSNAVDDIYFAAHYEISGARSWIHFLNDAESNGVGITGDGSGGALITGNINRDIDDQTNQGGYDGFIIYLDNEGNKSWTRLVGSTTDDGITDVVSDKSGTIFLAGVSRRHHDNLLVHDAFVGKITLSEWSVYDTPPTLQSTTARRNQLILTFSEGIQIAGGGVLNLAYMTVNVDGQTRKITRSQITAPDQPSIHTASQLALTLSGRSLDHASSISISYNPPSNGTTSGFITDLTGNKLAAITSQAIDTFSTSTSILRRGIASAYKNLILTGSTPISGYGNAQNNTITGNDANNILDGLAGADTMLGGLGDDTYVVDNIGDQITELGSAGTDTVQSNISYTLADNLENLTLLGSAAINGTGNSANNVLTGNSAANTLNGNGGTDNLIGGLGNDTYIVDSADDIINESGSSRDIDSVQASVSWNLGANLENLTLTETSAIDGTGNTLNNTISGNGASNILDGGNGGTDRLTGLGGADTFRFSTRPSSFKNTAADHITDFSSAQGDKIQITKSAFGITASTATLSVVNTATALNMALSTATLFVYNSANGELHWNQNRITRGAGSGGVLAILDNKATLSAGDLILV